MKQWFPEYSYMPNCTQYIQPYEYGEKARKKTGLWLKGLPKLTPTKIVKPELIEYTKANGKKQLFQGVFAVVSNKKTVQKLEVKHFLVLQRLWHNNGVIILHFKI